MYDTFYFDEHKLAHEDVLRRDRQNYRSAQNVCSDSVIEWEKMANGYDGQAPNPSVIGTQV